MRAPLLALLLLALPLVAQAQTPEEFYRGRTITLAIGYAPGGGYDTYARLFARYFGRHVPGRPTVATQNVPGAGSLKLANDIVNTAPRDGTIVAAIGREQVTAPLFGIPGTHFDPATMDWLGNLDQASSLCVVWHTVPVTSMQDLKSREMVVGATGPASTTTLLPLALKEELGYRLKVISGYPGGNDVNLALERGEVEGRCVWSYASIMSTHPDWLRDGKIRILAATSLKRLPELPDVPTVLELAPNQRAGQILQLFVAGDAMARPFLAPPGLPPARLAALRDAFMATARDPDFLAEAKKQHLELDPMDWRAMSEAVAGLYRTPPDVVKAAMAIIEHAGK